MQSFNCVFVSPSLPSLPQALLKLPSHISQSEEVLKFFETNSEDLNPPKEWVTITAYFRNHELSLSISISSVIWTKHCPLVGFNRLCVLTHPDPEAVSEMIDECWFEGHLLIMISGRWHLIPKTNALGWVVSRECSWVQVSEQIRLSAVICHTRFKSGSNYRQAARLVSV